MFRQDIEARNAFLLTFEWLVAVMERYTCPIEFGLVHIAYGEKNELGEAYGAQEAIRQLAAVTLSLKKAFRKTDLVARNGADFWIIVPYTSATEKIYDKVLKILQDASHDDLHIVDCKIAIFSLPTKLTELQKSPAELTSLEFLAHLKDHEHVYAHHTFRLPAIERAAP